MLSNDLLLLCLPVLCCLFCCFKLDARCECMTGRILFLKAVGKDRDSMIYFYCYMIVGPYNNIYEVKEESGYR